MESRRGPNVPPPKTTLRVGRAAASDGTAPGPLAVTGLPGDGLSRRRSVALGRASVNLKFTCSRGARPIRKGSTSSSSSVAAAAPPTAPALRPLLGCGAHISGTERCIAAPRQDTSPQPLTWRLRQPLAHIPRTPVAPRATQAQPPLVPLGSAGVGPHPDTQRRSSESWSHVVCFCRFFLAFLVFFGFFAANL